MCPCGVDCTVLALRVVPIMLSTTKDSFSAKRPRMVSMTTRAQTAAPPGLRLSSALDALLTPIEFDWVVQNETLTVTTKDSASALLEGVTLGFDARFGATTIAASLDLQNPEDQATGLLLPRRARQHGAVTLGHTIGAVRFGAEVVASSYRYDNVANTRRLAGYDGARDADSSCRNCPSRPCSPQVYTPLSAVSPL